MRSSVYRRLWRFNAFVIAGLGVAAIAMLASATVIAILSWHYMSGDLVDHAPGAAPPARTRAQPDLRDLEPIPGTPFLGVTVTDHEDDQRPYGSGSLVSKSGSEETADRNVLLIDQRDGSSRYILPDNGHALVQWHVLAERDGSARAYVALVGEAGKTSGDGARYDVLVGNFDTGSQAWVARGISALEEPRLVADDSIGFLVWQGDALTFRRYSLANLSEEVSRPIALMPIPDRPGRD